MARSPFGIGPRYFLRPDCGKARWQEYLHNANSRGLNAYNVCPAVFAPWEDLLPQPLSDVRRQLGIVPFVEDSSRWLDKSKLGKRASTGFGAQSGEAKQAQLARKVVEAGVDYRDLYRFSDEKARSLHLLAANGATDAQIREAAGRST